MKGANSAPDRARKLVTMLRQMMMVGRPMGLLRCVPKLPSSYAALHGPLKGLAEPL